MYKNTDTCCLLAMCRVVVVVVVSVTFAPPLLNQKDWSALWNLGELSLHPLFWICWKVKNAHYVILPNTVLSCKYMQNIQIIDFHVIHFAGIPMTPYSFFTVCRTTIGHSKQQHEPFGVIKLSNMFTKIRASVHRMQCKHVVYLWGAVWDRWTCRTRARTRTDGTSLFRCLSMIKPKQTHL